jgi:transposase
VFLESPIMIQITPQMRIMAAVEPADFRKGIDGLARLCKEVLKHDPFSGWVFVFRNRSARALKILVYDGQGFWLCQKRLSSGRFGWWPACRPSTDGARGSSKTLAAHQLQVLLPTTKLKIFHACRKDTSLQPSRHATCMLPRPTAALVPSRLIRFSISENSRTCLRIKNR